MKIFLITSSILLLQALCMAQTGGGFSNLYLYKGERATNFSDVVYSGDTLVAYGISYTSDTSPYTGIDLVLFDTLGNHIGDYTQPPLSNELMLQWFDNDLIKLQSGGYACTGILFTTQRAYLVQFNSDGSLFASYIYEVENIYTIFPQRLLEMSSGGFLLGGFVQQQEDYAGDIFLKRIDAAGNEVWSRTYGGPIHNELIQSALPIDQNLVAIGGSKSSSFSTPIGSSWTKSWIFAVDKLGLIKWEWESPLNQEGGVVGLHQTEDKGWIYMTSTHQILNPETTANHIKVVRRDSSFNLVWERILSPLGPPTNRKSGFGPTPDGNWVAVGTWAYKTGPGEYDREFYNCVYKLNNQGDTLWGVRLKAPLGYEGIAYPGGITVLPSGSVVWALRYDRYEPLPGLSHGWLIKVDNEGCVDTLCALSDVNTLPEINKEAFQVFPNPAQQAVNFVLDTSFPSPVQIKVWDISGNLVWTQEFLSKTIWNVADVPTGFYFYTLSGGFENLRSGKITVMH